MRMRSSWGGRAPPKLLASSSVANGTCALHGTICSAVRRGITCVTLAAANNQAESMAKWQASADPNNGCTLCSNTNWVSGLGS